MIRLLASSFFFSSRRRHTWCYRDWSSDVCSSDLSPTGGCPPNSFSRLREKLFGGHPPVGETVQINGMRFTVIGAMDRKFQDSNYFTSDDESAFIDRKSVV